MEQDCIFCKIIAGEIPSPRLYEDDKMIIIRDVAPRANYHYLCIPKEHFAYLADLNERRAETLKECFLKIAERKDSLGLSGGYRVVINQGDDAGQTVKHLHIHLLGGEVLGDL